MAEHTRSWRGVRAAFACSCLVASVAALALLSGVARGGGTATKPAGPNLWAGDWKTSDGTVGWRLLSPPEIANARRAPEHGELFDKLPCKNDGPQFYEGGYVAGESGKVIACGTPTQIEGRWLSAVTATNHGSFTLEINSQQPLTFRGTATPDGGKPFPWTGSWLKHFAGDGAEVPFVVTFSVIVKGKPNIAIKGGAPLRTARLSGRGHVELTVNKGDLLEATETKGKVTLDETYADGRTEHLELGVQSKSLYSPATNRLALLLDVKQSTDPSCKRGSFFHPTVATLNLLPSGGARDVAIFFGVPYKQTPKEFAFITTTPCKGGHAHGWEDGSGGVLVRVLLRAREAF